MRNRITLREKNRRYQSKRVQEGIKTREKGKDEEFMFTRIDLPGNWNKVYKKRPIRVR